MFMCGIAGIFGTEKLCTYENVKNMMQLQIHRGPDDQGLLGIQVKNKKYFDLINNPDTRKEMCDGVLGFNRLSIRDVSHNGHQPMISDDEKVIMTFNGEIYNADEYRERLKSIGYFFKGNSDTEVILNMYLEYGLDYVVNNLDGMFAICILDFRSRKLILVDDRVGIKPLYYYCKNGFLMFSSEIKSFLTIDNFKRQIDFEAVQQYLAFRNGLGTVLLRDIYQLKPGHMLIHDLETKSVYLKKYFDLNKFKRFSNDSYKFDLSEMEEILKESVKMQMVSDVKVGCQLSGGVDSSLVTYIAHNKGGKTDLNDSISVIFNEQALSEEKYIDYVSNLLKINSHKRVMNEKEFLDNIPRAIWHTDAILSHPNSLGIMFLSEEARKHVTVLLSGEGADELFGGYYNYVQREQLKIGEIPFYEIGGERIANIDEFLIKGNGYVGERICKRMFAEYDADLIYESRKQLLDSFTGDDFDKNVKYEMSTYLPELLVRQDKMCMANTIENRVPILGNKVIEYACSLPKEVMLKKVYKCQIEKYEGKMPLKLLAEKYYGENFAYRNKMGFEIPFRLYFRNYKFKEFFYDIIMHGIKERGIFNSIAVERLYEKMPVLRWNEAETLWKMINFEIWFQIFIDGKDYHEMML